VRVTIDAVEAERVERTCEIRSSGVTMRNYIIRNVTTID
jgi:hypothetical protein